MARRHLPVIASAPPAPSPAPAAPTTPEEAPPWHWIPLGSTISVVVFALMAPGAVKLGTRVLGHFYGHATTPQAMLAMRALHPRLAMVHEAVTGLLSLGTLFASIALGGYVIGRHGRDTNDRHGTLSGLCTASLFWAITHMMPSLLLCIPLGMLAGNLGARAGLHVRHRAD